ncbi:unnamed protein product, partial [Prorocentrum cordatum]
GEGGGSSGARSSQAPLVCASLPPRVPAAALLQGGRSPQARLAARDPWSRRGPASPGAWEEPDMRAEDTPSNNQWSLPDAPAAERRAESVELPFGFVEPARLRGSGSG